MYESNAGLKGLRWLLWSAVFAAALCLMAAAILSACDDGPPPSPAPESTGPLTPSSTNAPTPISTPTATIGPTVPTAPDELRSTRERAAPSATDAERSSLVSGNSTFAFDLYRALGATDGNLFYSPYSISLALAMTYAGARGETERQMARTLHFLLPQGRLHPAFNDLALKIASGGVRAQGRDDEGFRLKIANGVWGQRGYEFLEPFLDVLAENYGAGVRPIDFREAPEGSRLTINEWVADRTEDRIRDLVPPDSIDSLTRLVLTNAIYFNAAWAYPFHESQTKIDRFHRLDGGSVDVPMMTVDTELSYASVEGYQAVELPYEGDGMSMVILVPDLGRFREFEESLDAALVSRIIRDLERVSVFLIMPRFEFESQFELAETLAEMGMANAFDEGASDLSGMDGRSCAAGDVPCLFILDVIHKAFVSVNELGTEAAAATGVIVQLQSEALDKPKRVVLWVDRPFVFLIRDLATNTILFVGRVEELPEATPELAAVPAGSSTHVPAAISSVGDFVSVSAGDSHTCGVKSDRSVVCWGSDEYGQATPEAGKFSSVSAGPRYTCGVRADGTIACWGEGLFGEATPPSGEFSSVSAGGHHACGVRSNGSVACWGSNREGEASPPTGYFSSISAGGRYTCGVRTDGSVACWGEGLFGEATPPSGYFSLVSVGGFRTCGVRTDGSLTCRGSNVAGRATPPRGEFSSVSVKSYHSCGVRTDGSVACWGDNGSGEATPPSGDFVSVSTGTNYTCGVRTDGSVACWGSNRGGGATPP